jgi:hypothetical protein
LERNEEAGQKKPYQDVGPLSVVMIETGTLIRATLKGTVVEKTDPWSHATPFAYASGLGGCFQLHWRGKRISLSKTKRSVSCVNRAE